MLFKCFGEDEDVVHVDHNFACEDKVFEQNVHRALESCRGVGETKEHDQRFVKSTVGQEHCFLFVAFFYLDVVEAPSYVKFGEVDSVLQDVDHFGYEW